HERCRLGPEGPAEVRASHVRARRADVRPALPRRPDEVGGAPGEAVGQRWPGDAPRPHRHRSSARERGAAAGDGGRSGRRAAAARYVPALSSDSADEGLGASGRRRPWPGHRPAPRPAGPPSPTRPPRPPQSCPPTAATRRPLPERTRGHWYGTSRHRTPSPPRRRTNGYARRDRGPAPADRPLVAGPGRHRGRSAGVRRLFDLAGLRERRLLRGAVRLAVLLAVPGGELRADAGRTELGAVRQL